MRCAFQYDYDYNWATGTYSMLGQRVAVTTSGAAIRPSYPTQTKYGYDANYQLTGATQGAIVRTWTYDAIGNRVYATGAAPYTYYKNGTNPLNGQRLQNDGAGADFTYDANGNMTGRAGSPMYTWDYANRLTAAGATSYTYDHAGRRISATTSGTTTKYIPLGMNTVRESTGTTVRDYIFAPGIDEPLANVQNGVVAYYVIDGLGSIVATNDASGTILDTFSYDVWGVGQTVPLFGYTGRESAGPLWFLRARYYDPSMGRFLSEDPFTQRAVQAAISLGSSNIPVLPDYAYTGNRPTMLTDPLGLLPSTQQAKCMSGCADTFKNDLYKCLRTYTITQLGCTAAFVGCVGLSGGTATPACIPGICAL